MCPKFASIILLGLGRITRLIGWFRYYLNNQTHMVAISYGGPPTTAYWKRDGFFIKSSIKGPYSTSLSPHMRSYISRLVVKGYLPGKYEYFVSNRDTDQALSVTIHVDGKLHAEHSHAGGNE